MKNVTGDQKNDNKMFLPLTDSLLNKPRKAVTIWGTGLLTLDVVLNSDLRLAPRLSAGGTCGNVLIILSYLGWQAFPIARLNGDTASKYVMRDLKRWQVRTNYAKQSPSANTPIIVQRIIQNQRGEPSHKFTWVCPHCGAWLPSYRAVTREAVAELLEKATFPRVFFFDRVSSAALLLAKAAAAKGSLVFFEPSGIGEPKLFAEAVAVSHIVKYATDRAASFQELRGSAQPWLEIETQGRDGLQYRIAQLGQAGKSTPKWQHLPAFAVADFKDAAGSGDWCTAGIIHALGQHGATGLNPMQPKQVISALRIGQALAAWNCSYEGPRGGMYSVSRTAFRNAIGRILTEGRLPSRRTTSTSPQVSTMRLNGSLCPACDLV